MVHVVKSIDAHVGGALVRLLVDGVPRPSGKTMAQKRTWMNRRATPLRRALMLEPRGHAQLSGALFTEPCAPGAHAGLLFMDAQEFSALSGAGVIAATTVALERDLIVLGDDSSDEIGAAPRLTFETAAGTVHAQARVETHGTTRRVGSVLFTNVPSFVAYPGLPVKLGSRELRVDIAFGGSFFAIADTEAVGIPLEADRLPELRRVALHIRDAINAMGLVEHPLDRSAAGVAATIFTGPPHDPEAHLRNVTIFGAGAVDRSASATGTSAVMAVLDAMGLLDAEQAFVHESLIGSLHRGRIAGRTQVGDVAALVAEIEGTAWIVGEHTFYMDDDDPWKEGFEL